ncbi:MAG TPA: ABC transporter permease subunit [Microbacteriaceae bacterium]
MEIIVDAFYWLLDSENWLGKGSIPQRVYEHLLYSFGAILVASLFALPIGYFIGHTGKGQQFVVGLSGASRALPSFGLILALALVLGVSQRDSAAIISLSLLAFAPLLTGAYAGVQAISSDTVLSARAQGMTELQLFFRVELPLSLGILFGAIRNASLQVIATATLISYVGLGGLGYEIIQGIPLRRYDQMIGSALVVALLALAIDWLLSKLQKIATPKGVYEFVGTK